MPALPHETGRCTCGQAELAVTGRARAMFLCACTECQRETGSGHGAVILAPGEAVKISGELTSFTRPADSGADVTRHFCPVCGVTVYGTTSRRPGDVLFSPGIFGKSDWFAPTQVIYARSALSWDSLPSEIPHHQTYKENSHAQ